MISITTVFSCCLDIHSMKYVHSVSGTQLLYMAIIDTVDSIEAVITFYVINIPLGPFC